MAVTIEMPKGFAGLAYNDLGDVGYTFKNREFAVAHIDPDQCWGNSYLKQDEDSGFWIWWMDYI